MAAEQKYRTIIYGESKDSPKLRTVDVDTLTDDPKVYVVYAFPASNTKLEKQLMGWLIISLQEYSAQINTASLFKTCADEVSLDLHLAIKIQMLIAQYAEHFGLTKMYL